MKGTAMPDLARNYDADDLEDFRYHKARFVEQIRNWLGMSFAGTGPYASHNAFGSAAPIDTCGVTYDY